VGGQVFPGQMTLRGRGGGEHSAQLGIINDTRREKEHPWAKALHQMFSGPNSDLTNFLASAARLLSEKKITV